MESRQKIRKYVIAEVFIGLLSLINNIANRLLLVSLQMLSHFCL